MALIYNKKGEQKDVPVSEMYKYLSQGWSVKPISASANIKQPVQNKVVQQPQSKWTPAMVTSYEAMQKYISDLGKQGKIVNPNIEITAEMTNKFLNQAKTELQPYYDQVFREAERDMNIAFEDIGKSLQQTQSQINRSYGQALESTQENLARRGLNYSTVRTRAEQDLGQSANEALVSARTEAENKFRNVGLASERNLGSGMIKPTSYAVPELRPLTQMQPGQYNLQATPGKLGYSPFGNIVGEEQRNRLFAEQNRAKELGSSERELKGIYYK